MPKEDEKISKYKHGENSLKIPFLISFDNEVLLLKMSSSENNPDKYSAEKNAKHIPPRCAWSLTSSFDSTKNKHGYVRGEHCIEKLCKKFKELPMEIANYEQKE